MTDETKHPDLLRAAQLVAGRTRGQVRVVCSHGSLVGWIHATVDGPVWSAVVDTPADDLHRRRRDRAAVGLADMLDHIGEPLLLDRLPDDFGIAATCAKQGLHTTRAGYLRAKLGPLSTNWPRKVAMVQSTTTEMR